MPRRSSTSRPAPIVLGLAALAALVAWTAFAAPPRDFPVDELAGSVHLAGITMPAWVLLVVSVVLGTAVPYLMTLAGISRIGPTPTTVAGMIEPVLAVLLSWAWLGQTLTVLQGVGAVRGARSGRRRAARAARLDRGRGLSRLPDHENGGSVPTRAAVSMASRPDAPPAARLIAQ